MRHLKRRRGPKSAIYGVNRSRLHVAQGERCALCAGRFGRDAPATADHVFPKCMCAWRGLGNVVLAHGPCNRRKGNRAPTGCELIWLMFVNARLGVKMPAVVTAKAFSEPMRRVMEVGARMQMRSTPAATASSGA